jgi:hypothetical protein
MQRLGMFPAELESQDGLCEVRISLVGDPERAVIEVLNIIDGWLVHTNIKRTRVHIDNHAYTISAPTGPTVPQAPARNGRQALKDAARA